MIHSLENKKELNDLSGALLQFDPDTQRWRVEVTAFGTLAGKQLAIKPTNLRAAPPEVKVDVPVVGGPEVDGTDGLKAPEEEEAHSVSFGSSNGGYNHWEKSRKQGVMYWGRRAKKRGLKIADGAASRSLADQLRNQLHRHRS